MNWTKKPPTKSGYYWLFHESNNIKHTRIVYVDAYGNAHAPGKSGRLMLFDSEAKWLGPITPEMCGG